MLAMTLNSRVLSWALPVKFVEGDDNCSLLSSIAEDLRRVVVNVNRQSCNEISPSLCPAI